MNLKSLRYCVYGAQLTEKYCQCASFCCSAQVYQVYTRHMKYHAPKFQFLRALLTEYIR